MAPDAKIYAHAWLPTYIRTYMHLHTVYTYYSHSNFVSADQKANKLSSRFKFLVAIYLKKKNNTMRILILNILG